MEEKSVEKALVGSLLSEYEETVHVLEEAGVTHDMFSEDMARDSFKSCFKAKSKHGSCNMLAVVEELSSIKGTDKWTAQQYLESCIDCSGFAWDIDGYCRILKESWAKRRLGDGCKVATAMLTDNRPLDEVISEVNTTLNSVNGCLAKSGDEDSIASVTDRAVQQWEQAHSGGVVGVPSSWNALNEYIGSWMYGDAHVIGAYRDTGKTFVMTNEVVHATTMLKEPIPTCIVSLDMRTEQIAQRMISQIAEFSTFVMDTGRGGHNHGAMRSAKAVLDKAPIHFYSGSGDIKRILNTLRVHVRKYGVKSVWIDYFQRLSGNSRHSNRNSELEYVVRAICDFLGEHQVAGNILSQFNRSSEQQDRRPRLSDLKDCGSLEQDSRKVVLISPDPNTERCDNIFDWDIAKNNTGPTGTISMKRVANRSRWDVAI